MSDNNNIDEILDIDSLHEDHADDNDKPEKVKAASADKNKKEGGKKTEDEYEDVCFVCRRPESRAGKMVHLPNKMCIRDRL